MGQFTLDNPVFRVYVIAASIAILKMLGHAFLTVFRMIRHRRAADGGHGGLCAC